MKDRPQARAIDGHLGNGLAARRDALRILSDVLVHQRMAPTAETAEAGRLADTVFRRLGQIDAILSSMVERKPPDPATNILRLLAAELLFAGTAPHAAVDCAVRLSKADRRATRLAGLVNAVGRRIAAEGPGLLAQQDAAELNSPDWLDRILTSDWGDVATRQIAQAHLELAPHDLCLRNPSDAAVLARELDAMPLPTGGLRLSGRPQISALPGFDQGAWWVQDAAAQIPVRLLGDVAGSRVLDLCCAPGGKTMQLCAAGAKVVAVDVSPSRMRRVRENLARTGLSAELVVADATEWSPPDRFDAILLDAPCSATGTLRRHPDLLHRGRPNLAALVALQASLLRRAWEWLAPGGKLVFATCSLARAEGEDQVRSFLSAHPEAERVAMTSEEMPAELIDAHGDFRSRADFWPQVGGLDGFFATRLVRRA